MKFNVLHSRRNEFRVSPTKVSNTKKAFFINLDKYWLLREMSTTGIYLSASFLKRITLLIVNLVKLICMSCIFFKFIHIHMF